MAYTLQQLADAVDGKLMGDGQLRIDRVAPIESADAGAISFVSSEKFARHLAGTQASAVIIPEALSEQSPVPAILVNKPRAAYARIAQLLYPPEKPPAGIHPTAVVHESASIGADCSIGAHTVIGENVSIGKGAVIEAGCSIGHDSSIGEATHLHANVSVYHDCRIGKQCIIHSSTVIGADGFGFEHDQGQWLKIPQIGGVVIGDNVEIGACSTVDRGAVNDTIIEEGVKLDNHIQIAHNVQVGAHTVMSNGVGVAGSTRIGKNCLIGGMTGIKDHIEIVDNVMITAMSLVSKSLTKPGSYSSNTPIDDTRTWRRNTARFRQLDELARRLIQLEKQINNSSSSR